MYHLIRPALFALSAETSHEVTLDMLGAAQRLGLLRMLLPEFPRHDVTEFCGMQLPNAVGLAAGLDKNGDYIAALSELGFGFIEVGTVTPRPQVGNPKPRLFRLPADQAIINRMGFNNFGVEHCVRQVEKSHTEAAIGINIGKNKDTPNEKALDDYRYCLTMAYPVADYITVNISSPNTPGLRHLQFGEHLVALLAMLKKQQTLLRAEYHRYVPVAVKIAPDLALEEIDELAQQFIDHEVDFIIVSNTTVSRPDLAHAGIAEEQGGLSGKPLKKLANTALAELHARLGDKIPLVGVGGILEGKDAVEKVASGAKLVQLYTGLIYRGPALVSECVRALAEQ